MTFFLGSTACRRIERGDPACIAGRSGIELVLDVALEVTGRTPEAEPQEHFYRSAEFWIGWAIAFYQWYSDRRFFEIFSAVPFEDLQRMYSPLHEADLTKFVEIMDRRLAQYYPDTNLRRFRKICGITQQELSGLSGVNLRSIQMYEQRRKDINKASAQTLYRLSKALCVTMEDLLEKRPDQEDPDMELLSGGLFS